MNKNLKQALSRVSSLIEDGDVAVSLSYVEDGKQCGISVSLGTSGSASISYYESPIVTASSPEAPAVAAV